MRSGKEADIAAAPSPKNRACDFHRTRLKPCVTPLSRDAVSQAANLVDGLADDSSRVTRPDSTAPRFLHPLVVVGDGGASRLHIQALGRKRHIRLFVPTKVSATVDSRVLAPPSDAVRVLQNRVPMRDHRVKPN